MKEKAALAIAALMLASLAMGITIGSTTTVSASHTATVTIDKTLLKGNQSVILTITVSNDGPSAISEVEVSLPSGFSDPRALVKIPKNNVLQLEDNVVVLPLGTLVSLKNSETVDIDNTTELIREKDTWVWVLIGGENVQLAENARVRSKELNSVDLEKDDNIAPAKDTEVTLSDNELRVVEDILAVRTGPASVKLPGNIIAAIVASEVTTGDNLKDNIVLKVTKKENLTDNKVVTISSVRGKARGFSETTIWPDTLLELMQNNEVVISEGTTVTLAGNADVNVPENTVVKVKENTILVVKDPTSVENQPVNWTQEMNTLKVTWKGIADNKIAPGQSLSFPFATTTPNTSGSYTIYVRTKDKDGAIYLSTVTVTVDATPPTIQKIEISPMWAKANTEVTIRVTASEPLAKMENVYVLENENSTDPVQITMAPADEENKVWVGTYTTSDNVLRDGVACVTVVGAQYEDLVGNKGSDASESFYVDKVKPPAPDVQSLFSPSFPIGGKTNKGAWLLEGYTKDNRWGEIVEKIENMTVKIRIGTTTYEVKSVVGGYFYRNITLVEGRNEIGVAFVDLAGNEGDENVENIIYDATKPSITMVSISGKSYVPNMAINDNTPRFVLRIEDAVMGVENDDFDETDNSGYIVVLCKDDNSKIAELKPISAPENDPFFSFVFENEYPTELVDNWYKINVAAGDNLQSENVYFRFRIKVMPPSAPSSSPIWNPLYHTSFTEPKILTSSTMTLRGENVEPNSTVKIYVRDASTGEVLSTQTASVNELGRWSTSITIPRAGKILQIEVTCIDEAGNESSATLYGFVLLDATPPKVTITSPKTGTKTSKASIEVTGTVTKESWEEWKSITLEIAVGTSKVSIPISAVGDTAVFSHSVILSEGTNTILVTAIDAAGNVDSVSVTVTRTVTPWGTYAVVLVIIALILAAIAILRVKK
ncbi:MAG: hypothetical protein QW603_03645 [Candidatus Hadarchaeales archaeon]